jgi:hypothetical protein
MWRTYHGESMVKSNFYTRLHTKENQISLDSLGLLDQLLWVYWPKSASVQLNQTIKAIDLACKLYERRWDSWAFCSGRWDSWDESYLYLQILFTNLKKGIFFTHRSHEKNPTSWSGHCTRVKSRSGGRVSGATRPDFSNSQVSGVHPTPNPILVGYRVRVGWTPITL